MKRLSNFMLSKWYLDCVSDCGDVFIAYIAMVRWKAISLKYSSVLEMASGRPSRSRTSLQKCSQPAMVDESLCWSSASLDVRGSWKPISDPIECKIYESDTGDINWKCVAPVAEANIHLENQRSLRGLGYAEQLSMSIPPWQLPIDELRWGRFLCRDDYLVWIEWRGPHPISLVFHNGTVVEKAKVLDNRVEMPNGSLVISETDRQVLREGVLINTALAKVPGLRRVIPSRILNAHEVKWAAVGTIHKPDEPDLAGTVIHEVVKWAA